MAPRHEDCIHNVRLFIPVPGLRSGRLESSCIHCVILPQSGLHNPERPVILYWNRGSTQPIIPRNWVALSLDAKTCCQILGFADFQMAFTIHDQLFTVKFRVNPTSTPRL